MQNPITVDRLSDADAIMWRIERDPVLRSPILAVLQLAATPDRDEVLNALDRAVGVVPRLRCRVVADGPLPGRLRWEEDPDFHVEAHLRVRRLSGRAGVAAALDVLAEDAAAAFDPARPPWTATFVTGLRDHRSILALRFHHSIADGVGSVQLAGSLFDPLDASTAPPPTAAPAPARRAGGPLGLAGSALGAAVRTTTGALRDPVGAVRTAERTARSISRLLTPATEPLSPLWTRRSIDRRLYVAELPLPHLRRAGARWDSSINDVFLGAVAGALHEHHRQRGVEVPALRFTMPVNRRSSEDAPGGNRFTPVRFVLPVDDPSVEMRVRLAGNLSRSWRREPSVGFTDVLATALNRLPDEALTNVFAGMMRGVDVDAVDVPGLRDPVQLAGAAVERLWAFAPPTGAALSITLLSHLDLACVGIEIDTAAVPDADDLASELVRALEDTVAAVGRVEVEA